MRTARSTSFRIQLRRARYFAPRLTSLLLASLTACGGTLSRGGEPRSGSGGDGRAEGGSAKCSVQSVKRAPLRRLSHVEYNRTVKDLFPKVSAEHLHQDFTPDVEVHGFENDAMALAARPLVVEQYEAAAASVAERATDHLANILPCTPTTADGIDCVTLFLDGFGPRALRRPLERAERERYLAFYRANWRALGSREALEIMIQAMLQSPSFLYRLELDGGGGGDVVPLDAYELASRLSYLLWQSMPDDALFAAAASGALQDPAELEAQARRMSKDERAVNALVDFHRQWFELSDVLDQSKDMNAFPKWTDGLRDDLHEEALRFLRRVFAEGDGTLRSVLTANQTYANPRVAELYGVKVSGEDWQPVTLPAEQRAGILTTGAFLASRAHSTNGSPPLRGVAVLERLLCASPPPPPAAADTSNPAGDGKDPRTNRELFEERTASSTCQNCHRSIDGIGFVFEAYDATGRFRTEDNGLPVDTHGELVDTDVDGPVRDAVELAQHLARSAAVRECAAEKLYTYAYGRPPAPDEHCKVAVLDAALDSSGGDLREALIALVKSHEFRHRAAGKL